MKKQRKDSYEVSENAASSHLNSDSEESSEALSSSQDDEGSGDSDGEGILHDGPRIHMPTSCYCNDDLDQESFMDVDE